MTDINIYSTDTYTEFSHLDIFLEEIIGIKKDGYFIEIGAFDGQTNSKTARLADIGWSGIYAEPVKEYAERCRNRHAQNKVLVLQNAIGDKDETKPIYKSGLPSTLVADNKDYLEDFARLQSFSFGFQEEQVQVLSWTNFKKNFSTQTPDLFVLDAEGFDLKILQCIDFTEFRPHIICTEVFPENTIFMHPSILQEGKKIMDILIKSGYHIWLIEEHNILLVDGKALPLSIDEMKNHFPPASLINHIANTLYPEVKEKLTPDDYKLLPEALPFFRQLLQTVILTGNLAAAETYLGILEIMVPQPDASLNPLMLAAYKTLSRWENADKLLQERISTSGKTKETMLALLDVQLKRKDYVECLTTLNWLCENERTNLHWPVQKTLVEKVMAKLKTGS